jgi:anti-sigma B factor antagonist
VHVSVVGNPDDSVVVTVRGSLDLDSAAVLTATLDQVLERPVPRIVVDLSGVDFCDSKGLTAFIDGDRRASQAGGWLRLAAPAGTPLEVIEAVGLHWHVGVYPGVAEALAAHRDG